ncbi:hypothetical protein BKA70DRAFT_1404315 [Coprinopsis sp. MPI-PUGE-AT-0042]|nr:hypothetical protein BKA70DRAFT_1404315 [Coprinopsis sp. MPI-PUGE-AT-0042]
MVIPPTMTSLSSPLALWFLLPQESVVSIRERCLENSSQRWCLPSRSCILGNIGSTNTEQQTILKVLLDDYGVTLKAAKLFWSSRISPKTSSTLYLAGISSGLANAAFTRTWANRKQNTLRLSRMAIPSLYSSNYAVGGPTANAFFATLVLPPPKDDRHTHEFHRLFSSSPINRDTIPTHLHCLRFTRNEAALPTLPSCLRLSLDSSGSMSWTCSIQMAHGLRESHPRLLKCFTEREGCPLRLNSHCATWSNSAATHTKSFHRGGHPRSPHLRPSTRLLGRLSYRQVERTTVLIGGLGRVFVKADGRHGTVKDRNKNNVACCETLTLANALDTCAKTSKHHRRKPSVIVTDNGAAPGERGAVGGLEHKGCGPSSILPSTPPVLGFCQ